MTHISSYINYTKHQLQPSVESYNSMHYIVVAYIYKLNTILLQPLKSREDTSFQSQSVYTESEEKGHPPNLYVLDNKCSHAIKNFIATQKVLLHIVAPNDHKVNACDPAVKPSNYHVISSIATTYKTVLSNYGSGFSRKCNGPSTYSTHHDKTAVLSPTMNSMAPSLETRHS